MPPKGKRDAWVETEIGSRFGALVTALRSEQPGRSRADLADGSHVSYAALSAVELGARWPSDDFLTKVAAALGLEMDGLIAIRDNLEVESPTDQQRVVRAWLAASARALGRRVEEDPVGPTGFKADLRWRERDGAAVYVAVRRGRDGRPQVSVQTMADAPAGSGSDARPADSSSRAAAAAEAVGGDAAPSSRRARIRSLLDQLDDEALDRVEAYVSGLVGSLPADAQT